MKPRVVSTQICAFSVMLIALTVFVVAHFQIDPRRFLLAKHSTNQFSPFYSIVNTATTSSTNFNSSVSSDHLIVDQPNNTTATTSVNETVSSQSQRSSYDEDDNDPVEDDERYTEVDSTLIDGDDNDDDADLVGTDPSVENMNTTKTDTDADADILVSSTANPKTNNISSTPIIANLSVTARSLQKRCNDALRRYYEGTERFTLQPIPPGTPSVLSEYISWHNVERPCLISNETHCDGSIPRVLVWRCVTILCGGVGDRMRGIRFLFLIAVVTRRLFFIDWPQRSASPYPLTTAVFPHTMDWRLPTKTLKRISKRPNVLSVFLVSGPLRKATRTMEEVRSVTSRIFIVPNETNFVKLWEKEHIIYLTNRMPRSSIHHLCDNPHASILQPLARQYLPQLGLERIIMHVLFTPTPLIVTLARHRASFNDNDNFQTGIVTPLGGYIAAHARTGIDVGEAHGERFQYISNHLGKAAKRLFQCSKDIMPVGNRGENLKIFLASDSHALKEYFISLAEKENITVLTEDRRPLHIDRRGTARKVNKDDGHNVCLAFLDVFADIFALAKADAFAFYHSGFAATAESFGQHAHSHELEGDHEGRRGECIPTEEDLIKNEKMRAFLASG